MDNFKTKFQKELSKKLIVKYNRKLKPSEFATYYNLQFTRSITSETARKWLLGLSMPRISVIKDLKSWLNLDLSDLFNWLIFAH